MSKAKEISMELNLKSLGFTKKELQERVVNQICNNLMSEVTFGEDNEYTSSPFEIKMRELIKKTIDDEIKAIADKHILPNVKTYVDNLTLQETNKWGEAKGKPITFIEHLIQRAEAYMTEEVNYEGKTRKDSYGSFTGAQTRITHMVHKHLHYHIENAMNTALKNANSHIVEGLEQTVKLKLAEISKSLKMNISHK